MGSRPFPITWRNALEIVRLIVDRYSTFWSNNSSSTIDLAQQIGNFSTGLLERLHADPVNYKVTGYLTSLRYAGDPNGDEANAAVHNIVLVLVGATLKFFKIKAAPSATTVPRVLARSITTPTDGDSESDPNADIWAALQVYDLVFVYFFVAAGLALVLMAVLMGLNKRQRGRRRFCKGD
ncbi:MAG: hypothetical protein Q9210_002351 [Variospora velana]